MVGIITAPLWLTALLLGRAWLHLRSCWLQQRADDLDGGIDAAASASDAVKGVLCSSPPFSAPMSGCHIISRMHSQNVNVRVCMSCLLRGYSPPYKSSSWCASCPSWAAIAESHMCSAPAGSGVEPHEHDCLSLVLTCSASP